jgi:hypothetical protein
MAFVFKKNKRELKPPFVLKAYSPSTGAWEEVEEFQEPKKLSEIRDLVDELKEEGYTRFRLEDSRGEKVWVRYYKQLEQEVIRKQASQVEQLQEMLEKYASTLERILEFTTKIRGDRHIDPHEILASNIAMIQTIQNLCKQSPWICGVNPNEGFDKDLLMLQMLMCMMTGGRMCFGFGVPQIPFQVPQYTAQQAPTPSPAPAPSPAPTPAPKVNPEALMPPTKEAVDVVNQAVTKALEDVSKVWVTECQVLETCKEGESS